ncbi:MAG: hypothetical protein BGO43_11650 [Gammaproteobacteria bacterium 39-13]|nr:hypothetical protein [Gammaproteobacteria bacterium]OJV85280.1 MAG: hypothetical protein BGO43_11650 [Gammaproteobacteria bacterium 39-13]
MSEKINNEKIQEAIERFAKEGQTKEDLFRQLSSFLTATARNVDMLNSSSYGEYCSQSTAYQPSGGLNTDDKLSWSRIIQQIKEIQQRHPDMSKEETKRHKLG